MNTTQSQQVKPADIVVRVRSQSSISGLNDNDSNDDETSKTYYPYGPPPKQIKGVDLHHAVEINKIAKDAVKVFMKKFAQENILLDQLLKVPSTEKAQDKDHVEEIFRKSMADYKMRALLRAKALEEEEEKQRLKEVTSVQAIKFFSMGKTAAGGVVEDEESMLKKQLAEEDDEEELKQGATSPSQTSKNGSVADKTNLNGRIVDKDGEEVNEMMVSEKGVKFLVDGEKALANFDDLLLKKAKIKQYFLWMDAATNRSKFNSLMKETMDLKLLILQQQRVGPGNNNSGPNNPAAANNANNLFGNNGVATAAQIAEAQTIIASNERIIRRFMEKYRKLGLTPNDLKHPPESLSSNPPSPGQISLSDMMDGYSESNETEAVSINAENYALTAKSILKKTYSSTSLMLPNLGPTSAIPTLNTNTLAKFNDMNRKMSRSMTSRNLRLFSAENKTDEGGSPSEKTKKTYDPFSWRNSIVKKKKLSNFTDVRNFLPLSYVLGKQCTLVAR